MAAFALLAILAILLWACSPPAPTPSRAPTSAPAVVETPATSSPSTTQSASPSVASLMSPDGSQSPSPLVFDPEAGYAALDGAPASAGARDRLPVAVMVDDNVQARPQYGFNAASIVYQAPADGGEDRYMFVYQELDAKRVEPVRSGRPYFVNWASEYRSAFAHYGGDAKTLAYLPTISGRTIFNVDAIYGSASAFRRDGRRVAPHNGVTSTAAVRRLAVKRGAPATVGTALEVRPFSDDLPPSDRPTKASIRIPYSRGVTSYEYDKSANAYLRSVSDKPQIDRADGKRVLARNVVVLYMGLSVDPESEPHHHRPLLDHIGRGKALVFRDGHVTKGTWRKTSPSGLTRFFDATGKEIQLVRGSIFIQVVATRIKVTYVAAP